MTTKQRKCTPQSVSALLRKAGFRRSESRATAVRGWYHSTRGFRCVRTWDDDGSVTVEHVLADADLIGGREKAVRNNALRDYEAALLPHYSVMRETRMVDVLIVREKEAAQ